MQRKASLETNSKAEISKSFPENTKNELDLILNKNENPEIKEALEQKVFETPVARPWSLIKATMFSAFEYNGEFADILKEVKKSLKRKFREVLSDSCNLIFLKKLNSEKIFNF